MRLAILGSTRGTNLQALITAINERALLANIELVISNKKDAIILSRAASYGLPTEYVDPTGLTRDEYDRKLDSLLKQHQIEVIALIGYMRILSHDFVRAWQKKIINVHPSLLPDFAGMMDLEVHRAVLAAKRSESGCTVHYVTEQVDGGPIIIQKKCPVFPDDTPEELKARVQALEGDALVESLNILRSQ